MKNTIELYKRWKDNSSNGEVSTPIELVREMLDKIPVEVWENPESKFLDPCMGKGTFLLEIVNRLVYIYNYSTEDAISRVYGYDVRFKYISYLEDVGFKNVFHKDFLNEEFNMKFDVIVGNPPYTIGKNKTIWNLFVEKSFELCKEEGYVSLIHPNGWRNIGGRFGKIQNLIKNKEVQYLSMNSIVEVITTLQLK
jgi:type I restriction-modification system DNA methylase subunit